MPTARQLATELRVPVFLPQRVGGWRRGGERARRGRGSA